MGSPEADCAAAEVVGTPESAFEELTGPLQGWKRKVCGARPTLNSVVGARECGNLGCEIR